MLFFHSLVAVCVEYATELISPSWIVNAHVADSHIGAVKWLICNFMERGEERKIAYFPLTVYEIATVLRYIISITFLCLQHLCTAAGAWLGFSCMEISDGGGEVPLCIPHNMGTGVLFSAGCWSTKCAVQMHAPRRTSSFLMKNTQCWHISVKMLWLEERQRHLHIFSSRMFRGSILQPELSSQIMPVVHRLLNRL